jgi:hypothetical protein
VRTNRYRRPNVAERRIPIAFIRVRWSGRASIKDQRGWALKRQLAVAAIAIGGVVVPVGVASPAHAASSNAFDASIQCNLSVYRLSQNGGTISKQLYNQCNNSYAWKPPCKNTPLYLRFTGLNGGGSKTYALVVGKSPRIVKGSAAMQHTC